MDVDADVSRFLKHLESERRLSPRTVVSYRKDLEDLGIFLDDHYGAGGMGMGDPGADRFSRLHGVVWEQKTDPSNRRPEAVGHTHVLPVPSSRGPCAE